MRLARRASVLLSLTLACAAVAPGLVRGAGATFGELGALTVLGEPLQFSTTILGVPDSATVEVLVRLTGHDPTIVIPAVAGSESGAYQATAEIDVPSSIECSCYADGQSAPNSQIGYQFRVTGADGTTQLGPIGHSTVSDTRFNWQTIEEDQVRVHWYEGDESFARSAMTVANEAIDNASELLGATLDAPVDLFIYATEDAMREALSPNRENVAGQAHQTIQTMFVWIPPDQSADAFAGVLVAHELTHLVFDKATLNDYHGPPRWLNEGTAVYLSEGYATQWRSIVDSTARTGELIPLQGLAGFFPSPQDQFYLAYGEAVAAVDYFVRTYSEEALWNLVRSYAAGLPDDDAFRAATGGDVAAFNVAWMASLGTVVREPTGPQPAPAGPVPSAWQVEQQASPSVSGAPGSPSTGSPGTSAQPGESGPARTPTPVSTPAPTPPSGGSDPSPVVVIGIGVAVVLLALLLVGLLIARGRSRQQPPPPRWY